MSTGSEPNRKVLVTDHPWDSLDLERKILQTLGVEVIAARSSTEAELAELAADVDGIFTCWKPVTAKIIHNARRCWIVCRYGIGLDNIDVDCATRMGILVTNVPGYCVDEVSEHAIAMLLCLARKIAIYNQQVKSGSYKLEAGAPLYRIKGKTLGIVGFGQIGKAVFRKALALDLRVLAYDHRSNDKFLEKANVERVSFVDLVKRSDFLTIHVPLTRETHHLFDSTAFRLMKPTAFLINTARGEVIDSKSLLEALDHGLIAGAALDVLAKEPPDADDPLITHRNTIITPHAAFYSEESLFKLRNTAANQMAEALSCRIPRNVANREVLDHSNLRMTARKTV